LWVEGGQNQALTSSGRVTDVRLSDDEAVVAFTRQVDDFHWELWAVNSDGSNERLLVGVNDLEALPDITREEFTRAIVPARFEWVPGTHQLAYNTQQVGEGPGQFLSDDLRLVNADSLERITLFPEGMGGQFYYSPDGKQIAIVTPTKISLIDSNGMNPREKVLSYPEVMTYSEYWYYARPVWAPDSSLLVAAIPPQDPLAEPRQPTTLWNIPITGESGRLAGSIDTTAFFASEVSFSPDLSRIAFLRETGDPALNQRELYIASNDGNEATLYHTASFLQFLGWAGSSDQFLFQSGDPPVYQVGRVGGDFTPLPGVPAGYFDVRFVDDQRFLHLAEINGQFDLQLTDMSGNSVTIASPIGTPASYDFVK